MRARKREARSGRFVALCGGIGGAKLALGLQHVLGERLTVIVNVGDDLTYCGLPVSPDIDTVLYTLSGKSHPEQGWGRAEETREVFSTLERDFGEETWFDLGDKDIALHLYRLRDLQAGVPLSATVDEVARMFGIAARIAPISDDPVRTMLDTDVGQIDFQTYFVKLRCNTKVRHITYEGASGAILSPIAAAALDDPELAGIIVCPSNPLLSVGPMLALSGLTERLKARRVPCVAVSPIVGGAAIKGPTARNFVDCGLEPSVAGVARLYEGLSDKMLIDPVDNVHAGTMRALGIAPVEARPMIMASLDDKIALAHATLDSLDPFA